VAEVGRFGIENASLRTIVSKCADALGNGAAISHDCSIAFMGELPSEIGLHVASLTEDRDAWKEQSDSLRAEVERLEKERDVMLDDIRELDAVCSVLGCEDSLETASEYARSALDEVDHLRAKLERATGRMETVCGRFEEDMRQGYKTKDKEFAVSMLRPLLAEADAQAQNALSSGGSATGETGASPVAIYPDASIEIIPGAPAQQTQISDEHPNPRR
jgi:hypothetical protein